MMNKERIRQLADHIERQPHDTEYKGGFNMSRFVHSGCGTPACIAGFAVALWGDFEAARKASDFDEKAAEILDLKEFHGVFWPDRRTIDPDSITPAAAARYLRALADEKPITWTEAMSDA